MFSAVLAFTLTLFHVLHADTSASRFNCDANLMLNDTLRQQILKFHNDARRRIAKGVEPNKSGMLNPAANMIKLRWNCEMEKLANERVAECSALEGKIGTYGANSAVFHTTAVSFEELSSRAMNAWWAGAKETGVNSANEYDSCGLFSFSQMANARASEMGCSIKDCGTKIEILCLYNAIGHFRGSPMWETGEACSECVGATCKNGLCIKPREVPDDGKNTICPYNKGMTDKVRTRILDTHNELRSRTAKGLAKNGTVPKSYAPSARVMYKLKYDCYLEEKALSHAQRCVTGHSHAHHRPNIGENVFAMSVAGADKSMAGEWVLPLAYPYFQATLDWFHELKQFGVSADNRFTKALTSRKNMVIGHYTQVVWGLTQYVGCGVKNSCAARTVVVCNYSPAGNTLEHYIYEPGVPCSRCPPSTKCFEDEDLCIFPDSPY